MQTFISNIKDSFFYYKLKKLVYLILDIFFLPILLFISILSRFVPKNKIGIGPLPIINSAGHKKSLELYGYSAETFVDCLWYTTSKFDIVLPKLFQNTFLRIFSAYVLFIFSILRYKIIYHYFNGICLRSTTILYKFEPYLLKISGVKSVVMSYGMDVQDLKITSNIFYKDAYIKDYKDFRYYRNETIEKIKIWTNLSDFVLSGCDWVNYLYYWDKLIVSHFAVDDFEKIKLSPKKHTSFNKKRPMIIGHAPNHRNIKGTNHILRIVSKLKKKGFNIKFNIYENIPNAQFKKLIQNNDLFIDQIIVGWYAMLSIECMVRGIPVMCKLDQNLLNFYKYNDILKDDIPIIDIDINNLEKKIIYFYQNSNKLKKFENEGPKYVKKYHSPKYIGSIFDEINKKLLKKF